MQRTFAIVGLAAFLLLSATTMVFAEIEEVDNFDYEPLVKFCKSIYKRHHPYLAYRNNNLYEQKLHAKAVNLADHLESTMKNHETKDHAKFTCAEAREVLSHEHAVAFVSWFTKLMDGTVEATVSDPELPEPKYTNEQLQEKLQELRAELDESRLVNVEVLQEVDDIIGNLAALGNIYPKLKNTFDSVNSKDTADDQCRADYVTFVNELKEIYGEMIPKWKGLDEGILHLIVQCSHGDDKVIDLEQVDKEDL